MIIHYAWWRIKLYLIIGLGFNIAGGKGTKHTTDDNGIFITKIIPGGAADEEGTLAVGDRIVQVDEHSMVEITHAMATDILHSTGSCVKIHYERTSNTEVSSNISRCNSSPSKTRKDSCVDIFPYQERLVTLQRSEGQDTCNG